MPKVDPTLYTLRMAVKKVRHEATPEPGPGFRSHRVPSDLARDGFRGMTLGTDAGSALVAAGERLAEDPRFEWLDAKEAKEALWRLACEAKAKPSETGLAEAFFGEYAHEPRSQTCYFPVEGLGTTTEIDLFGIQTRSNIIS